jgi:hypothetical protein
MLTSLNNVFCLTLIGAAWLTVATLTVVVSPAAVVCGLALPGFTSAAMHEVR